MSDRIKDSRIRKYRLSDGRIVDLEPTSVTITGDEKIHVNWDGTTDRDNLFYDYTNNKFYLIHYGNHNETTKGLSERSPEGPGSR